MLEFDTVSKRFGALAALDACSFVAKPGRLTGFLGPNGAGKTTTLRMIAGLELPTGGRVRPLLSGQRSGPLARRRDRP